MLQVYPMFEIPESDFFLPEQPVDLFDIRRGELFSTQVGAARHQRLLSFAKSPKADNPAFQRNVSCPILKFGFFPVMRDVLVSVPVVFCLLIVFTGENHFEWDIVFFRIWCRIVLKQTYSGSLVLDPDQILRSFIFETMECKQRFISSVTG